MVSKISLVTEKMRRKCCETEPKTKCTLMGRLRSSFSLKKTSHSSQKRSRTNLSMLAVKKRLKNYPQPDSRTLKVLALTSELKGLWSENFRGKLTTDLGMMKFYSLRKAKSALSSLGKIPMAAWVG